MASLVALAVLAGIADRAAAQDDEHLRQHSGEVTITADRVEVLQGIDDLVFTVTREFATSDELDVTVTMSRGILPFNRLSHTATIPARDTSTTLTVSTFSRNPGAVTGDVTATVTDGQHHDVGDPSTASTHVHVGNGLVTLQFSGSPMPVDESVGWSTDEVRLIARTIPNVPPPRKGFSVSVFTGDRTAKRKVDYQGFSRTFTIHGEPRGNWVADGDAYVSSVQVTVWPIDDDRDEGDEHFALQLQTLPYHPPAVRLVPADSSAPPCSRSSCVSSVVIVDDDTRGVTVRQANVLAVDEGTEVAYTVVLNSQPTDDVMVTPEVRDAIDAQIAVSPALVFTPGNWDRPQRVIVTASADDNAIDGSATIIHTADGGDYGDNGVTGASVAVREEDREADLAHSGDVTIAAKHDTALGGIDQVTLTVTRQVAADYDLDVPVTLSAGIIPADELSHSVTIDAGSVSAELVVSTSRLAPDAVTGDVTATVGDGLLHDVGDPLTATVRVYVGEPLLTVRLDRGSYTLDEGVGTSTDEVALIARTEPNVPPPIANVAMSLSTSPDTAEVREDYQGIFVVIDLPEGQSGDWIADGDTHTARVPVPVAIIDDGLVEGDETFRLRLDQASWLTSVISLIPADSEAELCTSDGCDSLVTIVDDDTRAVILDQTGPLSIEEGGTATYTVVLDSKPAGDVTVTPQLVGAVDAELSVSPALIFTSEDWDLRQTVTVTAGTDGNYTDGSATITHTVSGGDYESNGVTAPSVPVIEQDAERDAVVVTLVHVPDGTVIPDESNVAVGGTVVDGTTFGEDKQVFFRLLFSAADGGPAPHGVDVELSFEWNHFSPIVPISGEISRIVLSLPRVDVWDSAVQILDNDIGNPDGTMTARITGCERNGCVIGMPSEITVIIADDDGGPAAAPPGRPDPPRLVCASAGDGYVPTGIAASWTAPTFVGGAPVDGYDVQYHRRIAGSDPWAWGEWQDWGHAGTATSTTITGLDADALYGVRVRAVNANGHGQWSLPGTSWTGYSQDQCEFIDELTPNS